MDVISSKDTVVILGGTGFIGSYLIKELAKTRVKIVVACRDVESHLFLKICGAVGQISLVKIDVKDAQAVERVIIGAKYVVNLVGILVESKKYKFMDVHANLPHNIAKAARKCRVKSLIHVSALGVDKATTSRYAASKLQGEKLVLQEFPNAVIIRPSAVFGPEDKFTNLFNKIIKMLPVVPLIGGGYTKLQPIYVGDVAKALVKILHMSSDEVRGTVLELGGPKIYSLHKLMVYIMKCGKRKRIFVHMPFFVARLQAMLLQLLPSPLLTVDQVELLKYDNVLHDKNGLKTLGISPTPVEAVLPKYIN